MPKLTRYLNALLDWIARAYFWVYVKLLQRPPDQPFTRQADRINRRWPILTYGTALVIFNRIALLHGLWWILTIAVNVFAIWWFDHISKYAIKHPDNVPYQKPLTERVAGWAATRINYSNLLKG